MNRYIGIRINQIRKKIATLYIQVIMCKLRIVQGIVVLVYKFNFNGFKAK